MIELAAQELGSGGDSVYVHPDARTEVSASEEQEIESAIAEADADAIYIAVFSAALSRCLDRGCDIGDCVGCPVELTLRDSVHPAAVAVSVIATHQPCVVAVGHSSDIAPERGASGAHPLNRRPGAQQGLSEVVEDHLARPHGNSVREISLSLLSSPSCESCS